VRDGSADSIIPVDFHVLEHTESIAAGALGLQPAGGRRRSLAPSVIIRPS